jgi:hypothetical protein
MQGGVGFAELLDEKLREAGQRQACWTAAPSGPAAPPHPFLYVTPLQPFRASSYPLPPRAVPRPAQSATVRPEPSHRSRPRPASRATTAAPESGRATAVAAPLATGRVLTPSQREALVSFVRLGARLTPEFSESELRSAFRTLARRYHPDRHPTSGDAEKARLARVFADLNAHHQQLLSVFADPGR